MLLHRVSMITTFFPRRFIIGYIDDRSSLSEVDWATFFAKVRKLLRQRVHYWLYLQLWDKKNTESQFLRCKLEKISRKYTIFLRCDNKNKFCRCHVRVGVILEEVSCALKYLTPHAVVWASCDGWRWTVFGHRSPSSCKTDDVKQRHGHGVVEAECCAVLADCGATSRRDWIDGSLVWVVRVMSVHQRSPFRCA